MAEKQRCNSCLIRLVKLRHLQWNSVNKLSLAIYLIRFNFRFSLYLRTFDKPRRTVFSGLNDFLSVRTSKKIFSVRMIKTA